MVSEILEKQGLISGRTSKLVLEAPQIAMDAKPGQFVTLKFQEAGKPFSITIADTDPVNGTITLVYPVMGEATAMLEALDVGDEILELCGPLGGSFDIEPIGKWHKVLCIAEDIGIPLTHYLAKEHSKAGNYVIACISASSKDSLLFYDELSAFCDEVLVATKDGSLGVAGLVTDALKAYLDEGGRFSEIVNMCPTPMAQAVDKLCRVCGEKRRVKKLDILKRREAEVWGISYSVFDGEELLEASIKCFRSVVDYVNVVYSEISWYGEEANPTLLEHLIELRDKGLIDELIEFIPDIKEDARASEVKKRNVGLEAAKKFGCTYFMPIDADEFYRTDEIVSMQDLILENQITHPYCIVFNYGFIPSERYVWDNYWIGVAFFSKLVNSSKFGGESHFFLLCDDARTLSHYEGAKYYLLPQGAMHHMDLVRKDLSKKIRNSSTARVIASEKTRLKAREERKIVREKEMNSYPSKNLQVAPKFIRVPDEFNIGNFGED